jgi:hypothetical protein
MSSIESTLQCVNISVLGYFSTGLSTITVFQTRGARIRADTSKIVAISDGSL